MAPKTRYGILTVCVFMLTMACIIAGCSSNSSNQSTAKSPTATQTLQSDMNGITIEKFAFNPPTLTVKPGTTVIWTNRDGVDHTIVSDPGSAGQFKSEKLANGASYSFSFTQPGTFTYYCSIHPSMKGTIIVQP